MSTYQELKGLKVKYLSSDTSGDRIKEGELFYNSTSGNLKTFVIGISGGIDSALTSTLCAETGINTIVVSMPIHQNKDQLIRAHKHINWLVDNYENVQYGEFDLSNVYDTFASLFVDNQNHYVLIF